MPDWSYRPLLRPLLFRLPPSQARQLTVAVLSRVSRRRSGRALLDVVGRLRPHASLHRSFLGLSFQSPVGLGAGVDVNGEALQAIQTFGMGFVEVGPLTLDPVRLDGSRDVARRNTPTESLHGDCRPFNEGTRAAVAALSGARPAALPVFARLTPPPGASSLQVVHDWLNQIDLLRSTVDVFTLDLLVDAQPACELATIQKVAAAAAPQPVLLAIPPEMTASQVTQICSLIRDVQLPGALIRDTRFSPDGWTAGPGSFAPTLRTLERLRVQLGTESVLVAGGAHTPGEIHALLAAGASLVHVRAGLIFNGPGLAHRAHEAIALTSPPPAPPRGWLWMLLLGLGLMLGGALAGWVGLQWTVLPYDEAFLQRGGPGLSDINPHLRDFLTHDRLTLAGTMLSLGVLYAGLAYGPLRRGRAWAWDALRWSGSIGFLSFGLFLGYGYFDSLHAAVSLLLLPFFLLGLRDRPRTEGLADVPDLHNDRRWQLGMTGQLLWVATGAGLVLAGLTISAVGVTQVFVPQDLAFMHTTPDALRAMNTHVIPLIAHDRAGFGGALMSNGVGVLLSVLWGYRRGARWLWWTLLASGVPGFTAALWIHHHVGYLDAWHLLPAWVGAALFVGALALSAGFLLDPGRSVPQNALRPHTRTSGGM